MLASDGLWSRRRVRRGAAAAALLCSLGLGAFGLHRVWAAEPAAAKAGGEKHISSEAVSERTAALGDLENGFSAIAEKLEPSVVSIRIEKKVTMAGMNPGFDQFFRQFGGGDDEAAPGTPNGQDGQQPRVFGFPRGLNAPRTFNEHGAGSGLIVRQDGWILTNDHVAGGADKVTVTLHDGRSFTGTVRRDYRSDLALVKIPASGLVPVEFADSDRVRVGQWAIAFGSPFELDDTMTLGIISARQRQKEISEGGESRFYPSLLQTDASINPGNSGGPLVDIHGRVVGVNVAINTTTGGSVGIGFAIPANTARDVMDQLISNGKVTRGFLGIKPSSLTPAQRDEYHVQSGVLVEQVSDDTPASKAGFQVEDVIVRYNGRPVSDEVGFRDMVARTAPGSRVDVVVRRDGREITLTPTVGALPDEIANGAPAPATRTRPTAAQPVQKNDTKLGITVSAITDELGHRYNVAPDVKGVLVTDVDQSGAAAEAGLRPGMVIVRVNGQNVTTPEALENIVRGLHSGDTARIVVALHGDKGTTRTLVPVQVP